MKSEYDLVVAHYLYHQLDQATCLSTSNQQKQPWTGQNPLLKWSPETCNHSGQTPILASVKHIHDNSIELTIQDHT